MEDHKNKANQSKFGPNSTFAGGMNPKLTKSVGQNISCTAKNTISPGDMASSTQSLPNQVNTSLHQSQKIESEASKLSNKLTLAQTLKLEKKSMSNMSNIDAISMDVVDDEKLTQDQENNSTLSTLSNTGYNLVRGDNKISINQTGMDISESIENAASEITSQTSKSEFINMSSLKSPSKSGNNLITSQEVDSIINENEALTHENEESLNPHAEIDETDLTEMKMTEHDKVSKIETDKDQTEGDMDRKEEQPDQEDDWVSDHSGDEDEDPADDMSYEEADKLKMADDLEEKNLDDMSDADLLKHLDGLKQKASYRTSKLEALEKEVQKEPTKKKSSILNSLLAEGSEVPTLRLKPFLSGTGLQPTTINLKVEAKKLEPATKTTMARVVFWLKIV